MSKANRDKLSKLSDNELLESMKNPKGNDPVTIHTESGKVIDGNHRVMEAMTRALQGSGIITPNTTIPVQYYTPSSIFGK
jgi:hypothetical protein